MSEQDKRPVYMGSFERFKKEVQVKQDDIILQLGLTKKVLRFVMIVSYAALLAAIIAIAI